MTGVRNRIGLVVVLLLILIPAVYVLADEAYIDSDRFTVNAAEIDGDIQFADVTGCSVRMQVTNHGDDFEGHARVGDENVHMLHQLLKRLPRFGNRP